MELVRGHNYGRYLACLYLPPDARNAAFAIYAFDAEISRIGGVISDPMPGEIRLQWWRDVVRGRTQPDGNPVAQALIGIIKSHRLPVFKFERLLDARGFDLYHDVMPDKDSFEGYLGDICSALLHLIIMVVASSEEQEIHENSIANICGHGGVFVGCVELLKRMGEHHRAGRQFFPAELSEHLPVVAGGEKTSRINEGWLVDICDYANAHHNCTRLDFEQLPDHCRVVFLPMASACLELDVIGASGIDLSVLHHRPSRLKLWWGVRKAVKSGTI